ncbi:hypothetical protein [Chryseobacterium sp.]|uniref:hypothetical protein n=1 Tax=Chryseobacterium sp. TaxID=1871047 RepID=UPI0028A173F9|nr:hypothetical protein [Chryseobacterium sp.]
MIKQNISTFLFSLFAIICLGIAAYFINHQPIFTIILAIGCLIFVLFAISEYLYNKNKNVLIKLNSGSSGVTINHSKLSLIRHSLGYFILIIMGAYLISLVGLDYRKYERRDYLFVAIGLYLAIYYLIKFLKTLAKFSHKEILIINETGITLHSEKMMWSEIKNEKIITTEESSGNSQSKYVVKYLSFNYKSKTIKFKIDDLDTPDYFIIQYLKLYGNRLNKNNFGNHLNQEIKSNFSVFENILKFKDLFSLDEKQLSKSIQNIQLLAKNNPEELKKYCESISEVEESNLESIYYALSEDSENWIDFLSDEFIRLFKIAEENPDSDKIFDILDEIFCDVEYSPHSKKVVDFLYHKLSHSNDKIRLKALIFIDLWLSEKDINRSNTVIQKMVKMTKDENWKIRWCAHDIVSSYRLFNDDEIAIPFQDKIKAKVNNQYEIN